MKTIKVSDTVHEELDEFKERDDHTSFDSAIRSLLFRDRLERLFDDIKTEREQLLDERDD